MYFFVFLIYRKNVSSVCPVPTGMHTNHKKKKAAPLHLKSCCALLRAAFLWGLSSIICLIVFTLLQRELRHWSDAILIRTILHWGSLLKNHETLSAFYLLLDVHAARRRFSQAHNLFPAFLKKEIRYCIFPSLWTEMKGDFKATLAGYLWVPKSAKPQQVSWT